MGSGAVQMQEKSVLELARDGDEPPQSYIHREEYRPFDSSSPESPIPVIDLQLLFSSGPSKEAEMEKLRSTLQSWGFFQAINHGVSSSLLDKVMDVGRDFFHLPMEEKQKNSKQAYGKEDDGLESIPQNLQHKTLDWNEQLYLQTMPEDARKVDRWPENPSSFREILHEYNVKINEVIHPVLRAMANLLGLEENYFVRQFDDNKATLYARFNYYPPCSRPDLVLGIKSHSDGSVLTVLLPDQAVDGLEVLKDNQWVKVRSVHHALLINIGDQMEIMSNGIFKSPVHRAVTNSEKERLSLAMFLAAEVDKEIGPADGLVDTSRPRLYKNIKVKDYLDIFLQNFMEGKRSIDWAKV